MVHYNNSPESQAPRAKLQFSPLPTQMMKDARIPGRMRVFLAVAYHDRLGKNGRGCFASYRKLSQETGVDDGNVSRFLADWVKWGYLTVRPSSDGKRKVYSVVYEPGTASIEIDPGAVEPTARLPMTAVGTSSESRRNPQNVDDNISCETLRLNKSCETALVEVSNEDEKKSREALHAREAKKGSERDAQASAHRRIVLSLGAELYAEALDRLSPEAWATADQREQAQHGTGHEYVARALREIKAAA